MEENTVSRFFCIHTHSLNVSVKSSAAADLLQDHSSLACSLTPVTEQNHHVDEINRGCKHSATCLGFSSCLGWISFNVGDDAFQPHIAFEQMPFKAH